MPQLFILRHGEAENYSSSGRDSDRALTAHGRAQVQSVLADTAALTLGVELVLASPYLRAQQTAEYVKASYPNAEFQTWDALVPESDPAYLCQRLNEKLLDRPNSNIVLVSHQPLVGTLLNELSGSINGQYPMDTASFAGLRLELCEKGLAELLWLKHVV